MLHARQGSELADLQQAHSERSARWLQCAHCILARQRRGLQLNQTLLTVREAEFKQWGGGYGLAGTWLRRHAATPAAAAEASGGLGGFSWMTPRWAVVAAEGFLGRCTASARGVCVC